MSRIGKTREESRQTIFLHCVKGCDNYRGIESGFYSFMLPKRLIPISCQLENYEYPDERVKEALRHFPNRSEG